MSRKVRALTAAHEYPQPHQRQTLTPYSEHKTSGSFQMVVLCTLIASEFFAIFVRDSESTLR